MKKEVKAIYSGINSKVGDFLVNRLLPGNNLQAIGPVVFLDHVYPVTLKKDGHSVPTGEFAHPHRGIATFSYVLTGSWHILTAEEITMLSVRAVFNG